MNIRIKDGTVIAQLTQRELRAMRETAATLAVIGRNFPDHAKLAESYVRFAMDLPDSGALVDGTQLDGVVIKEQASGEATDQERSGGGDEGGNGQKRLASGEGVSVPSDP